MGTLFSTLSIARLGLQAAQIQIEVAGHNIANANTVGYSRQKVNLTTPYPNRSSYGQLGRGVVVADISRVRDEFLDKMIRAQSAGLGAAEIQAEYYAQLEDSFLEPSDQGFGVRVNSFFDALSDLANSVEEYPVREAVVSEAVAVSDSIRQLALRLYDLRTNANEEVRNIVPQINSLTEQIYQSNILIRDAELNNSVANDLRDTRDRALDELSKLVNINYTIHMDGQATVRMGADILVDKTGSRQLVAAPDASLDPERGDLLSINYADSGYPVTVTDGELAAVLRVRDTIIPGVNARIDTLASTIIEQINRIQSSGNGLTNLTGTINGTNAVSVAGAPLIAAGLPFAPTVPGTFELAVYDNTNTQVPGSPFTVNIANTTTLNDLVTQLAAIPGVSASVNADNTLQIGVAAGSSFVFSNDTTGVLAALGVNTLFTGSSARTMGVSQAILDNPGLLSGGYDLDPLATGDNEAARAMAEVRNLLLLDNGSSTINDYYESTVAKIGVESRANTITLDTETAFNEDFESRRQEACGVSIDEEVTFMMTFQRAFEGAARVVTVVDRMLDTLLAMGA